MKKFKIVFDKMVYGTVMIDANNMEEAIKKAKQMPVQISDDMIDNWQVHEQSCNEVK